MSGRGLHAYYVRQALKHLRLAVTIEGSLNPLTDSMPHLRYWSYRARDHRRRAAANYRRAFEYSRFLPYGGLEAPPVGEQEVPPPTKVRRPRATRASRGMAATSEGTQPALVG